MAGDWAEWRRCDACGSAQLGRRFVGRMAGGFGPVRLWWRCDACGLATELPVTPACGEDAQATG